MTNALVQGRKKCRPGHEQAGETRANEMLLLLLEGPRGLKPSLLQSCSLGEEGKHCYCKSEECVALRKSLDYSAHHPWPLGFLADWSLRIALALAKQNSHWHGEKSLHGGKGICMPAVDTRRRQAGKGRPAVAEDLEKPNHHPWSASGQHREKVASLMSWPEMPAALPSVPGRLWPALCPPSSIKRCNNARHAANFISTPKVSDANPVHPHSLPIVFDAAVLKLLLVASMIIMLLPERPGTHGAPAKKCFHMKTPEHNGAAFRNLRNKYENLRFREVAPWWNCSGEHLRLPKLKALTKWEMLEAVESQLDLFIPVLQNQSEASFSQDASQVLDFLLPFRGELKACIQHMPAHPPKSGHLQEFKAQLQTFNTSNVEQSPKCLEAAVGLNIYRLLSDLTHHILHQDYRYHHRQQHCRHPSSN
ncbi:uncharacterized protein LOC140702033 [Pogona vitticeps]